MSITSGDLLFSCNCVQCTFYSTLKSIYLFSHIATLLWTVFHSDLSQKCLTLKGVAGHPVTEMMSYPFQRSKWNKPFPSCLVYYDVFFVNES